MAFNQGNLFEIGYRAWRGEYWKKISGQNEDAFENLLTVQFVAFLSLDSEALAAVFLELSGFGSLSGSIQVTGQPSLSEFRNLPGFPDFSTEKQPYPDIQFRSGKSMLLVEQKVSDALGANQVNRYVQTVEFIRSTGIDCKVAVLTRDDASDAVDAVRALHYSRPAHAPHFRWQDVYSLLTRLKPASDSCAQTLRTDFRQYLCDRTLACERVSSTEMQGLMLSEDPISRGRLKLHFEGIWSRARTWLRAHGFRVTKNNNVGTWVTVDLTKPDCFPQWLKTMTLDPCCAGDKGAVLLIALNLSPTHSGVCDAVMKSLPGARKRGKSRVQVELDLNAIFESANPSETFSFAIQEIVTKVVRIQI